MSTLNKTNFKALYGSSGATFPDNTTGEISEADIRQFGEDQADSFEFLSQTPTTVAIVAGSPNTLALNMASVSNKRFTVASAIAVDFRIDITNYTVMSVGILDFSCSAEVEITFESTPSIDARMQNNDTRWASGVLTLPTGYYQMSITYDSNAGFFKVACSDKFNT